MDPCAMPRPLSRCSSWSSSGSTTLPTGKSARRGTARHREARPSTLHPPPSTRRLRPHRYLHRRCGLACETSILAKLHCWQSQQMTVELRGGLGRLMTVGTETCHEVDQAVDWAAMAGVFALA